MKKLITFIEASGHDAYRMVTEPVDNELQRRGFLTEVIKPAEKQLPSKNSSMIVTNYFWALFKLKAIYDLKKLPIVYMTHGLSPWKYLNTGYEECNYIFLPSEFERNKAFQSGGKNPQDSHVFVTGWPKLDLLYEKNKHKNQIRESIIKELKLKNTEPIVVYLPTFTHRSKERIRGSVLSLKETDLKEINNFIIGIHMFDKTKHDVKNVISKFKYVWDKANKYDLMVAADLIVGDISSVLVESLILNKPIIHFVNNKISLGLYETDKYGECTLGDVCTDPKQLKSVIIKNLQQDSNKEKREEWKQKLIYNEGQATNAVVDNIIKILEEQYA
jgi:CDP-glycerol glycerophosphotransferase (TagB/SpsB family)